MYRFRREEQLLPDYEVASFHLCHHPDSFFRRDLVGGAGLSGRSSRATQQPAEHPSVAASPMERRLLDTAG